MQKFRMVVLVDMQDQTRHERAAKRRFSEWLFGNGFSQLQEGVFTRVVGDASRSKALEESMRRSAPDVGLIRVFTLTERQFQQGVLLAGENNAQESEIGSQADIFL